MRAVPSDLQNFNNLRYYMRCEGGAVEIAEKDGKFFVISDESSMSSFMSEDDLSGLSLTSVLEFDTAQERSEYLMKSFGLGDDERHYNNSVLSQIATMGFRKIGEWLLDGDKLDFRLSDYRYEYDHNLYAFICDEKLVYLGITDRNLEKYLYVYIYENSTGGNLIRSALSEYKQIEIHVLPDNGLIYFGGFQMNLANGLFSSMISEIKPEWNAGIVHVIQ